MTNDDWTQLLIKVRDTRCEDSFAQIFSHFAPRLKAYLMKSGTLAGTADEAVQEAMVQVWRKAHLYDAGFASASTWIFTIARNKRIDLLRKENRPEPDDLPWSVTAEPDPSEVVAVAQETMRLRAALAKLPAAQRDIVEKSYLQELSHSELAEVTGLPLGTIKSRIRLGLSRLRHELSV